MVKICQTGLLKLNFETRPKKCIFRFLPKISAGHGWSWKFFFANFQILGPLGCQGWVVIPQNVKKCQNHCTLIPQSSILTLAKVTKKWGKFSDFPFLIMITECVPTFSPDMKSAQVAFYVFLYPLDFFKLFLKVFLALFNKPMHLNGHG